MKRAALQMNLTDGKTPAEMALAVLNLVPRCLASPQGHVTSRPSCFATCCIGVHTYLCIHMSDRPSTEREYPLNDGQHFHIGICSADVILLHTARNQAAADFLLLPSADWHECRLLTSNDPNTVLSRREHSIPVSAIPKHSCSLHPQSLPLPGFENLQIPYAQWSEVARRPIVDWRCSMCGNSGEPRPAVGRMLAPATNTTPTDDTPIDTPTFIPPFSLPLLHTGIQCHCRSTCC